jgi:D-glycero-D-manno-heptose 1,7-bisphosphate phosphatase
MGIGDSMKGTLRRAVFLDRDGVLNRAILRDGKPYPPKALDDLEILPGVPESLRRLRQAGFLLLVVTNQPDVARGTQRREVIEAMHDHLLRQLPLDEILACYEDGDTCEDRKPNPGLLFKAAAKHSIELTEKSFMVGDRWRDIEAGNRAGCRTVFLDYGYQERRPACPHYTASNLPAATEWILLNSSTRESHRCLNSPT